MSFGYIIASRVEVDGSEILWKNWRKDYKW